MKLYYSPFACSLAAHIACREAGLDVELVRVDLRTKQTATGGDLFAENAMGQLPTLVLDDGRTLTENVAVLAYLAAQTPKSASASTAEPGPSDEYELLRWLSFVSTEIHKKVLWSIFASASPEAVKEYARASAGRGLDFVSARLESRETLVGGSFTVADAYLFWALNLLPHGGVALDGYPVLRRYHALHRSRPSVRAALVYEKQQQETPFATS
jgi:glutathione S-transferase